MSPVICMIRDTELLFSKKLSVQEKQSEPKRFKRLVRQFIRRIKPGERLLFVGMSAQPYRARIKALSQIYEHVILFPKPNYGSRRSKAPPVSAIVSACRSPQRSRMSLSSRKSG